MNAIKKSDLVHVDHGKVFTDTLVIAEKCELPHTSVIKLIRKYKNDFEELGRVRFEIDTFRTKGGSQQREYAELNEDQATYLITLFRNTDIVRAFKLKLVKEFRKVLNELQRIKSEPGRNDAIKHKRDAHTPMMEALKFIRAEHGKETTKNHFANENLFCNRALTGEWKPIDESTLDAYDLRLLQKIRERNTILEVLHPVQKDRKQLLDDFVAEYRTKHPRLQLVVS